MRSVCSQIEALDAERELQSVPVEQVSAAQREPGGDGCDREAAPHQGHPGPSPRKATNPLESGGLEGVEACDGSRLTRINSLHETTRPLRSPARIRSSGALGGDVDGGVEPVQRPDPV